MLVDTHNIKFSYDFKLHSLTVNMKIKRATLVQKQANGYHLINLRNKVPQTIIVDCFLPIHPCGTRRH